MRLQIADQQKQVKPERVVNISLRDGISEDGRVQVLIDGHPILDFIEMGDSKIIVRRYHLDLSLDYVETEREPRFGVPVIKVSF